MQLKRFFPIASTTVLMTVCQSTQLNFSMTSSVLPAVAQTSDIQTPQLASPIQLAQTIWARKAAMAQAQPLQEQQGNRLFQTGVEQFNRGQLQEALETYQQMLAKSRERGDKLGEAEAKSGIGEVYLFSLKPTTEALQVLQEALAIYQQIKDAPQIQFRRSQGQARTLTLTGLAYSQLNRKDEALKYMQKALLIQRLLKDKEGEGKTLNYVASLNIADYTTTDSNQLKQALEVLQQALVINREVGNSSNQIVSLGLLGWGHNRLGNNLQALKFLNEALAKSREKGYRLWEGQALVLMSIVYSSQGDTKQALASAQQALSISETIGSKGTSDALFLLGAIYQSQQQYSQALKFYQQALTMARQLKERATEDNLLNQIKLLGVAFNDSGVAYANQKKYEQALNSYQQALAIHREMSNRAGEKTTLDNLGDVYRYQGKPEQALEFYQQALAIHRELGDRTREGITLNKIGVIYNNQKKYDQALNYYQQALAIHREVKNGAEELTTLGNMASVYQNQKQYSQALKYYQQALAIAKQTENHTAEAQSLLNIGYTYQNWGYELLNASSFQQALDAFQQQLKLSQLALTIAQNLPDDERKKAALGIANAYSGIGLAYKAQKQYAQSIAATQQAINFAQQADHWELEFSNLVTLGYRHANVGEELVAAGKFQQALALLQQGLEYEQQALTLAQNDEQKRQALNGINFIYAETANVYIAQEQYPKVIEAYQQALAIDRQLGDRSSEASTLSYIAGYYLKLGQFRQALELYQQSLAIFRELGEPLEEIVALGGVGKTYGDLEQYSKAREHFQQALAIAKQQRVTRDEALILNNLGTIALAQGEYAQALKHFQQALQLDREVRRRLPTEAPNNLGRLCPSGESGDNQTSNLPAYLVHDVVKNQRNNCLELIRSGEAKTLSNIGLVYDGQGRYPEALENYQQSLMIAKELKNRDSEASFLNNIGAVYLKQGESPKALESFQQALKITTTIGDRAGERTSLNNIGRVYSEWGRYEASKRYRKASKKVSQIQRKVSNQRQDWTHKVAAQIVSSNSLVATEELNLKGMTRKAKKGSKRKAQKTGLNRSMLDVGIGNLIKTLEYKLQEAGGFLVMVPTKKVKPSQTCPDCGHQRKKDRSERVHHCSECGATYDRDVAAALVMLSWALGTSVLNRGEEIPTSSPRHTGGWKQISSVRRQKLAVQR